MKAQKTVHGVAIGLFSLWMIKNAYVYLTSPEAKQLCQHFGLPDYLRIELAIAKIIGVIVLWLPLKDGRLKEWAYAGFAITMISGFIAHLASGDPLAPSFSAILALAILMTSYFTGHKIKTVSNQ